jgi:hypothetical protein
MRTGGKGIEGFLEEKIALKRIGIFSRKKKKFHGTT